MRALVVVDLAETVEAALLAAKVPGRASLERPVHALMAPVLLRLAAEERESAETYVSAFAAWSAMRREEFGRLPQNEVVEFHAAGHYFFLEHPEQERALAAIRDFVGRLHSDEIEPRSRS